MEQKFHSLKKRRMTLNREAPLALPFPSIENQSTDDYDVVFVGAGPVGLASAIQIKLFRTHTTQIVLYEKHPVYQHAHHTVYLRQSAFAHSPVVTNLQFHQLVCSFPTIVKTSEVETKLRNFAVSLGIDIKYESLVDCKSVSERHPTAKVIVGSDGSHSMVAPRCFSRQVRTEAYDALRARSQVSNKVDDTRSGPSAQGREKRAYRLYHLVHETVSPNTVALRFFHQRGRVRGLKTATIQTSVFLSRRKENGSNTLVQHSGLGGLSTPRPR